MLYAVQGQFAGSNAPLDTQIVVPYALEGAMGRVAVGGQYAGAAAIMDTPTEDASATSSACPDLNVKSSSANALIYSCLINLNRHFFTQNYHEIVIWRGRGCASPVFRHTGPEWGPVL